MIDEITMATVGKFIMETKSGSKYYLSLGKKEKYLFRVNKNLHIRKDQEAIRILNMDTLKVGQPAIFHLAPINKNYEETIRITTCIVLISQWESIEAIKKENKSNIFNGVVLSQEVKINNGIASVGFTKYGYGDYVRFIFNSEIHFGQIILVNPRREEFLQEAITSYDILGEIKNKKQGFKSIPENDIIGLL